MEQFLHTVSSCHFLSHLKNGVVLRSNYVKMKEKMSECFPRPWIFKRGLMTPKVHYLFKDHPRSDFTKNFISLHIF